MLKFKSKILIQFTLTIFSLAVTLCSLTYLSNLKLDNNFLIDRAYSILKHKYAYITKLQTNSKYEDLFVAICKDKDNINPLSYEIVTYDTEKEEAMIVYHKITNLMYSEPVGYQAGLFYGSEFLIESFEKQTCSDIKTGNTLLPSNPSYKPLTPYKKWGDWISPLPQNDKEINKAILEYHISFSKIQQSKTESENNTNRREGILDSPVFVCKRNSYNVPTEFLIFGDGGNESFRLEFYSLKESTKLIKSEDIVFEGSVYSYLVKDVTSKANFETYIDSEARIGTPILHTSCESLKQKIVKPANLNNNY